MVAEQRETVQRIDADVMDISSNVGGAQRELLKYYASISSNRWLMLKVFGVLIVFVSAHTFYLHGIKILTGIHCSSSFLFSCHNLIARRAPFVNTLLGFLWTYTGICYSISIIINISNQPTGIALTPVPHSLPFGFPFFPLECFRPPRCVSPSSTSPTVHVRFPAAVCSIPDVVENR